MSWTAIASKDFQDAVRSRTLVGLTGLFVIFTSFLTYLLAEQPSIVGVALPESSSAFLEGLVGPVLIFVPLIGLIFGYPAIAGERSDGSLKFLMGFPHSRFDLVLGKVVGRAGVVAVSVVTGFVAATLVATAVFEFSPSLSAVLTYTLLTVVLATVFVSIGVGISAGIRSPNRALYAALGVFVTFQFLWNVIQALLLYATNGFSMPELSSIPDWMITFNLFRPGVAFQASAAYLIDGFGSITQSTAADPFYVQDWFGFVVLVPWLVLPAALGYVRLRRTDL